MFAMVSITSPLNVEKVIIEDELEEAFAERGEVTGAGVSQRGCHLDLEVDDDLGVSEVLRRIRSTLEKVGLTSETKITIESEEFLYTPSDMNGE